LISLNEMITLHTDNGQKRYIHDDRSEKLYAKRSAAKS